LSSSATVGTATTEQPLKHLPNARVRHTTNRTNQRTTIRIPQTQNSTGTHPPKILAPTRQPRRPTLRFNPRLLRQQRKRIKRHPRTSMV